MVRGDAGHARRGVGQAVIGAEPRDDLLLLRPAEQVVVVAHELVVRVVGVRARGAEEHLGEMAGVGLLAEQGEDAVGETDGRLVRGRAEEVIIAEILDRLGRRRGDLLAPVADIDAPQPGAEIDQVAPVLVLDAHAVAVGINRRAVLQMVAHRGHGMEQALLVHLLERVVAGGGGGHGRSSWFCPGRSSGLPIVGRSRGFRKSRRAISAPASAPPRRRRARRSRSGSFPAPCARGAAPRGFPRG
jgi:hypothetical protein